MMSRYLSLVVVTAVMVLVGGCNRAADDGPAPAAEGTQLTGVIRSNTGTPEAAITGWVIEEEGTGRVVPVDLGQVIEQAQMWAGSRVILTGTMADRETNGAKTRVFVAESILFAQP